MGNHSAGMEMGRAATAALKRRTTETALELLDEICEPHRNCDAEFEAEDPKKRGHVHPDYGNYTDPNGPLGKLIAEAFGEAGRDYIAPYLSEDEAGGDAWYDGTYTAFKNRYEFC